VQRPSAGACESLCEIGAEEFSSGPAIRRLRHDLQMTTSRFPAGIGKRGAVGIPDATAARTIGCQLSPFVSVQVVNPDVIGDIRHGYRQAIAVWRQIDHAVRPRRRFEKFGPPLTVYPRQPSERAIAARHVRNQAIGGSGEMALTEERLHADTRRHWKRI